MGVEKEYQAIPAQSGLIELAATDQALGELLCFVPGWLSRGYVSGRKPWPEADALWRIVSDLVRQSPGLEKRNCYLDRYWDIIHYLLSANRRDEPTSEEADLFDKAVRGPSEIADHVRGGQGHAVKYVPPADVERVAILLDSTAIDSLRAHYHPPRMEAACVYKFDAERAGEEEWGYIAEFFAAFRVFYLEAARHGEGVIVFTD